VPASAHSSQVGIASWYGERHAGNKTASGDAYDPDLPTAANNSLPLGTCARVTNLGNGRSVIVRIIDRGPFVRGRLIDVSSAAARSLGMKRKGIARVRVRAVPECPDPLSGPDESAAEKR
jgi:rare lipoprotein A